MEPTLWEPLKQAAQLDRVNPTVPVFDDRGGVQRYPFERCSLIIRRQMACDEMRGRADADDRGVRDVHLVAVGHVDLDPDIVASVSAWADPYGHRQPGRAR